MSALRVQLQQFEGPLDLLLYLIRKEEMNILDINIVEITKTYLDYIKLMKEFDLEVAGEFVAMAATLIHIKSKMLLPQYNENGEVLDVEDPRKELVQKLLEYEKYKEAARALYDRPLLNRDLWGRGLREKLEVKDDEIELEDNALFSLIAHYRAVMKTLHKRVHKVNVKLQSIASRILQLGERLVVGVQVTMAELYDKTIIEPREKMRSGLITFLSLLELGKMGYVGLYQTENYGDIYINTKKPIEGDVVSKVEEYDNINSADVAQSLLQPIISESELEEIDLMADEPVAAPAPQLDFETELALQMAALKAETEIADDMASDEEIFAAEHESIEAPIEYTHHADPDVNSGHEELTINSDEYKDIENV